jgi:type II secretory pathway pseudopilin PulG
MVNKKWFTIIELMVAIIIFTIWFLSAYLLVYSAINSSIRSKSEIIASNIAREQIELVKNIRDTNWIKNNDWDNIDSYLPLWTWTWNLSSFEYYTIENDYSSSSPVKIKKLESFDWSKGNILWTSNVRLCIDVNWRYFHCVSSWDKRTSFYSYIKIERLITENTISNHSVPVNWALRIQSFVINTDRWYNEFNINTIITDWKK